MSTVAEQIAGDGWADQVLDYRDSGAGPLAGPYGSVAGGENDNQPVPLSVVLGGESDFDNPSFLSLPNGSFVTVGFNDETIIDGPGDDFGVTEFSPAGERGAVSVSADGQQFFDIGIAYGGQTTTFDLASINFTDSVRAVRVEGLDNNGQAPGFDLENINVMPQSMGPGEGPLFTPLSARRPILIVPGILGSLPTTLNLPALLPGHSFPPNQLVPDPLLDTYGPLIRSLESLGYEQNRDLFVATYDWRLPIAPADGAIDGTLNLAASVDFTDDSNPDQNFQFGVQYLDYWLKTAQENWDATNPGQPFSVDIIAHSMGGLVTRALLQSDYFTQQWGSGAIHDVALLGTPNSGAIAPFELLAPNLGLDTAISDAADLLSPEDLTLVGELKIVWDMAKASGAVGDLIGDYVPSLYDLLPTDSGFVTGLAPDLSAFVNPLLPDLNANTDGLFNQVAGTLYSNYGVGQKTTQGVDYLGLNIITTSSSSDGDGTVLSNSAILPGSASAGFSSAHIDLPADAAVIQYVLQDELGLLLPANFTPAQRTWKGKIGRFLYGWLDPVDFSLTDSAGRQFGSSASVGYFDTIPGAFYSGDGDLEYFALPVDDQSGTVRMTLGGGSGGSYSGEFLYADGGVAAEREFSGSVGAGQTQEVDLGPPINLSISDASLPEGNTGTANLQFVATLSSASDEDVSISYDTTDGSATAGSDYQATSGVLTIPAGQTSGIISVPVIGDTLPEPDESFTLNLHDPTNATLGSAVAVGTISNDDPGPDLVGSFTLAGGSFIAGGLRGKASVSIVNQGSATAVGTMQTIFYLSTDAVLDIGTDIPLATAPPKRLKLKPGASKKTGVSFVYPDMADGTYYVLMSIDSANGIAEIDESNNVGASGALTGVNPSAHISAIVLGDLPVAVSARAKGTAEIELTNDGPIASLRAPVVELFLSTGPTLEDFQNLVVIVPSKKLKISPGAKKILRVHFNYPQIADGDYYLLAST